MNNSPEYPIVNRQAAPAPYSDAYSAVGASQLDDFAPRVRHQSLGTLRRYKWIILAVGVACALLALLVVSLVTPQYRSTAAVLIESSRAKLVSIDEVYGGASGGRENFQTQAEMLRSREVMLRVVKELGLDEHPEFSPRARPSRFSQWLVAAGLLQGPPSDPVAIEMDVLRRFGTRLSVEPVLLSNVIRVSFESADPALAARIANAIVDAFIQADMDNRFRMTQGASKWINERVNDLNAKLDTSERALQAYRDSEGLLDSKVTVLSGTGKQFDELMHKLVEARVRRSETEEAYNQVKSGEGRSDASTPAVVRNLLVQKAKETEADAERRLAEISGRYGPAHPAYTAAQSELNVARANVERQTRAVVASVQKEFLAARATEKTLEDALGRSKETIQDLNRKGIQVAQLEREVETNRQLYQTFLSRYKETKATSDLQLANARMIDAAVPGLYPAKPAKPALVGGAFVAGLLAAAAILLIRDRMDKTVRRVEDVEDKLHQPLLAALPTLKVTARRFTGRHVLDHPDSIYAESVRTATTGILLSALNGPRKVIAVTSSGAGEGKSTFSLNFCLAQAQSKSVVLVEADMRRPSLSATLRVPLGRLGLSELLAGTCDLRQALRRIKGTGLHYIVAGQPPANPLAALSSARYSELMGELLERYEVVVVDCPPVQPVSDALVIASQASGVVYVVRAAFTPAPLANAGLKRITEAGIPVFGVLLNNHDFEHAERYYGEYSGFGKYGYETDLKA